MSFEPFHGVSNNPNRGDAPALSVHPSRKGYLNATADSRHYQDYDEVVYLVDDAATQVAIAPADGRDGKRYALRRRTKTGANISLGGVLRRLDIDISSLESARSLPLEWNDDLAAGVVDLSPLADTETDAAGGQDSAGDEAVACQHPDCEDTFDSERGMKIHHGRMHGASSSEASEDSSEGKNSDVPLLTQQAESFVEDKGIRTLTGLADALGVPDAKARKHARQADVYGTIKDDAVSRPGVSD